MSVVVFCGPTISAAEVRKYIDAICLPPAGYGDVLRAVEMSPKPRVIAIIDGVFRTVPAVRHKEILWALSQGVHVFGAASMGALRASELHEFGMIGIGSIFRDYLSGRIEDDDEVAVEHGPSELGFLPLNEAMVDIRVTLEAAVRDGVIDRNTESRLADRAKQKFYAERSWANLIDFARASDINPLWIDALEAWLPAGRVYCKKKDARDMLAAISDFIATDPPPFEPRFIFERTDVWNIDYEAAHSLSRSIGGKYDAVRAQDILDELRLSPKDYAFIEREALVRALAMREARRQGIEPESEEKERALRDWLKEHGMTVQTALEGNRLTESELASFVKEEALIRWTSEALAHAVHGNLLGSLRSRGRLAPFIARAEAKQRALRDIGMEGVTTQTRDISPAALLGWFWRKTFPGQMQTMPPEALAERLGFADETAMTRAFLREYLFSEYSNDKSTTANEVNLT